MNSHGGLGAPRHGLQRGPSVCPHCWMVNPGPFRLCGRCGAAMNTHLQESGGLRRAAPVQSPIPIEVGGRLTIVQRAIVGVFVAVLALGYLAQLLPYPTGSPAARTVPAIPGAP